MGVSRYLWINSRRGGKPVANIKKKMICLDCQVDMNHHCDKIVFLTDQPRAGSVDLSLGGVIEEFHTCPNCGGGASRPA
jgi:hypothetical protein